MLEQNYLAATRCLLRYKLPLAHLVDDFFGKLKGRSRGYASLDYEDAGYEVSDIVKMEVEIVPLLILTDQPVASQWKPVGRTR
jgi:translation factor GUF1, mitochondrial